MKSTNFRLKAGLRTFTQSLQRRGQLKISSLLLFTLINRGVNKNFLQQRHRIIKRRQNERPRHSGGSELFHPGHRADLQRKNTSRDLLADRHAGNLDWNRRMVRVGVSHHFGVDRLSLRQAASTRLVLLRVFVPAWLILRTLNLAALCHLTNQIRCSIRKRLDRTRRLAAPRSHKAAPIAHKEIRHVVSLMIFVYY